MRYENKITLHEPKWLPVSVEPFLHPLSAQGLVSFDEVVDCVEIPNTLSNPFIRGHNWGNGGWIAFRGQE